MNSNVPNNSENVDIISEQEIVYSGTWEIKERSLTAAAFTALFVIGALYFNLQSILAVVVIFLYKLIFNIEITGTFMERVREFSSIMKFPFLTIVVLCQFLLMLAPTVWIVKHWHTKSFAKYVRLKTVPVTEVILTLLITISFLPFCYYFSYFLFDALDIPDIFSEISSLMFLANSPSEYIAMIFFVAVTPAICEEFFFRGYFQRTLERIFGWKSFLVTGIIFGLFHMQPLSLISLSILGVLFSLYYYRSKSIIPSSVSHFVNNFIAVSLLYFSAGPEGSEFMSQSDLTPELVIISLIIGGTLLAFYLSITQKNFIKK